VVRSLVGRWLRNPGTHTVECVGPGEGEPVLDEATENLTHPPDKLVETVRETFGMLSAEERADRAGGTAEDAVAYVLLPRSSKGCLDRRFEECSTDPLPTSRGVDKETSNDRELIRVDAERIGCKGHDLRGATLVDGDVAKRRPMVVGHQRNERNSASDEGSRRVDVVRWPSVDGPLCRQHARAPRHRPHSGEFAPAHSRADSPTVGVPRRPRRRGVGLESRTACLTRLFRVRATPSSSFRGTTSSAAAGTSEWALATANE
jgi:hypothetical protein